MEEEAADAEELIREEDSNKTLPWTKKEKQLRATTNDTIAVLEAFMLR